MWLHACHQNTENHTLSSEGHLGLGRNPIKVSVIVKISPAGQLEEFCLGLQFNSCILDFSFTLQLGFREGVHQLMTVAGSGSPRLFPFGGVRNPDLVLILVVVLTNPDSQNYYICCSCFMKSCQLPPSLWLVCVISSLGPRLSIWSAPKHCFGDFVFYLMTQVVSLSFLKFL